MRSIRENPMNLEITDFKVPKKKTYIFSNTPTGEENDLLHNLNQNEEIQFNFVWKIDKNEIIIQPISDERDHSSKTIMRIRYFGVNPYINISFRLNIYLSSPR